MNLTKLFNDELDRHADAVTKTKELLSDNFSELVTLCEKCLRNNGKIIFFGNGGSAADAQHLATELTVRYKLNRRALASIALTTDTSALTAIGNDFGFEHLFSRQIEALCNSNDVCIGITTSGTSLNVINGLKIARQLGGVTIGLGGRDGGVLGEYCDLTLVIPHEETARIQEMHILIGHMLCEALEKLMVE